MRVSVTAEVIIPSGATHYSGNLHKGYKFYAFRDVGQEMWCFAWDKIQRSYRQTYIGDINQVRKIVPDITELKSYIEETCVINGGMI